MTQTWIVKNKEGEMFGPYDREEMFHKIRTSEFIGEEQVSSYPTIDWKPIFQYPEFYDALLSAMTESKTSSSSYSKDNKIKDQLQNQETTSNKNEKTIALDNQTIRLEDNSPNLDEDLHDVTSIQDVTSIIDEDHSAEQFQPIEDQDPLDHQVPIEEDESSYDNFSSKEASIDIPSFDDEQLFQTDKNQMTDKEPIPSDRNQQQTDINNFGSLPPPPPAVISKKKRLKKTSRKPRLLLFCFLILLIWGLLFEKEEVLEDKETKTVTLLFPEKFNIGKISQSDLQKLYQQASQFFYKDTYINYLKAQDLLVTLAEEASDVPEVLALLCLTHRELWPYSEQTIEDKSAVSQVTQRMSKVQPIGVHQDTCNIVKYLLSNQQDIASNIIDKSIELHPDDPILYEFKAELLAEKKQYNSAVAYVQKAQSFWKPWLKLYAKEAEYNMANGEFLDALSILTNIYPKYPFHTLSEVLLGYIQLTVLRNPQEGIPLITKGLQSHDILVADMESKATLALAQYYVSQGKNEKALELAQKSYQKDLSNQTAIALIVTLGGQEALEAVEKTEKQMMALGDIYYQKGNFLEAQAPYKTVYDRNKKNGLAALKAGQTLWQLGLEKDAIEWVKKAIVANPKLIEAYVTAADYLSQRYEFDVAMGMLLRATQVTPQNYEIMKSTALLEFRRQNYKRAESFAKKALKLYDTDIETNILLSEILYYLEKYQESYQVISKVIQLLGKETKVQALYGKILTAFQGQNFGVNYLTKLISTDPKAIEYHASLAEIYIADQQYKQAEEVIIQAIQILNNSVAKQAQNKKKMQSLLGKVYVAMKDYNKALNAYIKAALADPSDAKPLFEIARIYMDVQKYNEVIHQLERVVRINEKYPKAYFYMGTAALELGKSKMALDVAKKEKQNNPSLSDPYVLAGKVYMRLGDHNKAIVEFQKAIKISPQGVQIYILLARAYRLSNNFDVAEQMIIQAGKLEAGNPNIYKEQARIFEGKGEIQRAIGAYDLYLKLAPNTYDRQAVEFKIFTLSQQ